MSVATRSWSTLRPPLPPFGARVSEAISRGEKPNVFITCGSDAWRRFELQTNRIVLPPESDPAQYYWGFMRGLEPTVVGDDAPHTMLKKLVWCLVSAGCPLVCLCYDDLEATAERPLEERVIRGNVVRVMFFRDE